MKSVGIFGANGFIGRHLTRSLVARGDRPICFARHFPEDFRNAFEPSVDMRVFDLHDEVDIADKLSGVTHVVQLINASNAVAGNSHLVADIHNNLIPHIHFIAACIRSGVKSYTFLSSGGTVYGNPRMVPITEEHPTYPLNSYGLTKLFTEQYLRMLCREAAMGFNILRVANPYGPGQLGAGGQGLIGTILQKFKQNAPLTIFGDGRSERDYLYIEDTIGAILCAVDAPALNDVVNIGSGQGRSVLEVLAAVEVALGSPIQREHIDGRTTDAPSNILDSRRARRLLGWAATTPFADGVAQTVAWNLRHGAT